ncbi:hypothetical protein SAMN05443144_102199 [Fodinibius roseus]|uniref:BD-FAE-like domain-containing protein n=1 Tax=Fodinibius roseus TaxID=1194090 RepID=A0A1M4V550_9BACT|nr:alpha/beta hydrolase [Fodinibius roseus]SHE64022.1 hypothetical protein SAMN05443144_102199 [Fodinibius roseus]
MLGSVLVVGFILSFRASSTTQVTSHRFGPPDGEVATEITAVDSSAYEFQYKKVDSVALDLTVFPSARSQSKAPAIVFFFGGGWKEGKMDQFKPHAEYFAQRGMTGILVDYRVASRHGTTPFDAVDDAREAVAFIGRNADYFIQTVLEAVRFLIEQQLLKGTPEIKEWIQHRN